MVAVTYIEHNGTEHKVDVDAHMNLMEGATLNMVPGVIGMCGGICSCSTCHCYIPPEWQGRIPQAEAGELGTLESVTHRKANSRLGCQITVTEEMQGLVVHLPADQAGS
jgi:2Fe-2S ferredoxin